jgi:cysteine-rich repeat protein
MYTHHMHHRKLRCALLCAFATVCDLGCVSSELTTCNNELCAAADVCVASGCATPQDAQACDGHDELSACRSETIVHGFCRGGACFEASCGDGVRDPDEKCDDGNVLASDGCASNCQSDETCGNGVLDIAVGETCDDGVRGLTGDGCSSQCQIEYPNWTTAIGIGVRMGAVMAFDSRRGRMVLFGGSDEVQDTWEFDGRVWQPIPTAVSPPGKTGMAMVFDQERGEVVLFGGGEGNIFNGTWTFDGLQWHEHPLRTSPGQRRRFSMAFDGFRKRVVLHGGLSIVDGDIFLLGDTWEWDGTQWILADDDANTPRGVTMAYDPLRQRVVMFGVSMVTPQIVVLWQWDGVKWSETTVPAPSQASDFELLTFDDDVKALRQTTTTSTDLNSFVLDHGIWKREDAIDCPNFIKSAVGYDSVARGILIYGGQTGPLAGPPSLQGYMYYQGRCKLVTTANTIERRDSPGSAVDELHRQLIVSGGESFDPLSTDTLALRGSVAIGFETTLSPIPWQRPSMCSLYDGRVLRFSNGQTLLFENNQWRTLQLTSHPNSALTMANEKPGTALGLDIEGTTWRFQDMTWQPTGSIVETRRRGTMMVFDPLRRATMLFGGTDDASSISTDELKKWDGQQWQPVPGSSGPSGRALGALAYNPLRRTVTLFGGKGSNGRKNDTWEWNGARWTRVATASSPPAMIQSAFGYSFAASMALVGGNFNEGTRMQSPTQIFELAWRAPNNPPDRCIAVQDTDGDGLVGCDDPDCWDRCTPYCPPGAVCDQSLPHCGDNVCQPFEDWSICPGDCALP